jgi:predicted metal-dependent phosphoesterase TrpH
MLKADFHIHTREDSKDGWIKYNAKDLINHASKLGFEVLAITNHGTFTYNEELANYAKEKGVLLIPGIEAYIEGRHAVILNATKEAEKLRTFEDLEEYKRKHPSSFVIAPHAFYPIFKSVHKRLLKHSNVFDAVEYSQHYLRFFNHYNKKAIKHAKRLNKPIIATSDTHRLIQFNRTYSLIDSEKDIDSVIRALRENKIELKTKPVSYLGFATMLFFMFCNRSRKLFFSRK